LQPEQRSRRSSSDGAEQNGNKNSLIKEMRLWSK
jgi:hypothetical protein